MFPSRPDTNKKPVWQLFLPLMMIHQRQTDLHPSLHCVQVSMIIHWFHNDPIIRLHSSLIDHLTLNKTAINFYNFCAKSCEGVWKNEDFLKMKFDWTKINRWRRKKNPGGSLGRTPAAEKNAPEIFFSGFRFGLGAGTFRPARSAVACLTPIGAAQVWTQVARESLSVGSWTRVELRKLVS